MKKVRNIFNKRELKYLSQKRPDLVPVNVPSRNDAKLFKLPSQNDAKLLEQPTLDQIIVEFLKQYDVIVKPRSVGEFNGWDALSLLTSFSNANNSVASSIFTANRSNQINNAALDWGTWKRWALDHKNFEQFKDEVLQNITLYNENAIKELEEAIRETKLNNEKVLKEIDEQIEKAEFNNQKIFEILEEPNAKQFIAEQKELANQKYALISFYSSILVIIIYFLGFSSAVFYAFGVLKSENFEVLSKLFASIGSISLLTSFLTGIKAIFTKSKKRKLGIIGTIISTTLIIFFKNAN